MPLFISIWTFISEAGGGGVIKIHLQLLERRVARVKIPAELTRTNESYQCLYERTILKTSLTH